jgi:hypothetical protein
MINIFAAMSLAGFAEHPPANIGNPARIVAAEACLMKLRLFVSDVIMSVILPFPAPAATGPAS